MWSAYKLRLPRAMIIWRNFSILFHSNKTFHRKQFSVVLYVLYCDDNTHTPLTSSSYADGVCTTTHSNNVKHLKKTHTHTHLFWQLTVFLWTKRMRHTTNILFTISVMKLKILRYSHAQNNPNFMLFHLF